MNQSEEKKPLLLSMSYTCAHLERFCSRQALWRNRRCGATGARALGMHGRVWHGCSQAAWPDDLVEVTPCACAQRPAPRMHALSAQVALFVAQMPGAWPRAKEPCGRHPNGRHPRIYLQFLHFHHVHIFEDMCIYRIYIYIYIYIYIHYIYDIYMIYIYDIYIYIYIYISIWICVHICICTWNVCEWYEVCRVCPLELILYPHVQVRLLYTKYIKHNGYICILTHRHTHFFHNTSIMHMHIYVYVCVHLSIYIHTYKVHVGMLAQALLACGLCSITCVASVTCISLHAYLLLVVDYSHARAREHLFWSACGWTDKHSSAYMHTRKWAHLLLCLECWGIPKTTYSNIQHTCALTPTYSTRVHYAAESCSHARELRHRWLHANYNYKLV